MIAEQKSRLAQGLFFGLLFFFLGGFMRDAGQRHRSVKRAGKAAEVMGVVIVAWGVRQAFVRPK
jgi:hypothetical protein